MKDIVLTGITHAKGGSQILSNLSLTIPGGEFFALLGPSGCGKTTLLRLISGLERIQGGAIHLGNEAIEKIPPHKRNINIVFQNYALFPHLTVFENVAYSLRLQKIPKQDVERRVLKILRSFHMEMHKDKTPSELSGGQQQRVAIARAIVDEPEVLLLDEPLAALDFKLREQMLVELIDLQETLKTTFIYVTHDQMEALTVADKMAIMQTDGTIAQMGTPEEIYEFPQSAFVARFVGNTNLLSGTYESGTVAIEGLGAFSASPKKMTETFEDGQEVTMSIRPEKIFIAKKPQENFSNTLEGTVESIVYHGRSTVYHVRVSDTHVLQIFDQNEVHFPQDEIDYEDRVHLFWQKENVVLLSR